MKAVKTCVRCLQEAPRPDARFCVHCGWPLVQPCPYDCGETEVPLLVERGATPRCPTCENPFKVCSDPHCGRLHRYNEQRCANEHRSSLVEPIVGWPQEGGRATRTFAFTKSDLRFHDGAWEPAFQTGDLRNAIGPMISAAGEVIYLVGRALQFWQPGSTPRSTLLDEPIPDESWRLMEVGGAIFSVGASAVFVNPIGRGKRWKAEGTYVSHGALDTIWVGIRRDGNQHFADLFASDGESIARHPLPGGEGAILPLLATSESAYAVSSTGTVWEIDAKGAREFARLADENVQYALLVDDSITTVSQRAQGIHVASVRLDGRLGPRFPIERLVDLACPPMASKGRILLVGRQPDRIFNIDALTLRTGFQPTHGYLNIEAGILLENGDASYAALAGGDQSQKAVTIVNTQSGHLVAQPFRTSGRASIKMIAADGLLIIATSQPGDNRIRAYRI